MHPWRTAPLLRAIWRPQTLFWMCVVLVWGFLYLFWLREYGSHLVSDGGWYLRTARHLYHDGIYSLGDVSERGALLPTSRFPPVFPGLLLMSYALFGDVPVTLEAVRVVLFGLALGTVFFTYRIGCLWNKRIGYLAATLAALDVHMLATAMNYDLPDSAVALFVTMGVFYFLRYLTGRQGAVDIALAALWLGVAMWTKVTAYLLWVPLVGILAWYLLRNRHLATWRKVTHVGVFLLVVLLFFGGWKIRNWYAVGTPSFTSQSGEAMLHYHAAYTLARARGTPDAAKVFERDLSLMRVPIEMEGLSIAQKDDYFYAMARRILLAHPASYLLVKLADIPNLLFGTLPPYYFFPRVSVGGIVQKFDTGVYVGHRTALPLLWAEGRYLYVAVYVVWKAMMLTLVVAACIGVVRMGRERRHSWLLAVLLVVISYILFVSTPVADPRYRPPLMPMVYVLAAYGFYSLHVLLRRARSVHDVGVLVAP
ncbi:glycosyltransferase family 39 protein [Candidatus Uhrbacteria bacterium]|nr:glycosyltransferase family 39 protein [Candidatus Uhrbacteria bacterium]